MLVKATGDCIMDLFSFCVGFLIGAVLIGGVIWRRLSHCALFFGEAVTILRDSLDEFRAHMSDPHSNDSLELRYQEMMTRAGGIFGVTPVREVEDV